MALIDPDATRDTTTSTGTGPWTVSNTPQIGYHVFIEKLAVGDNFTGFIRHRTIDEFMYGEFTLSSTTQVDVVRVDGGSNGTSEVSFSAGTKDIVASLVAGAGIDGGTF